MKTIEEIVQNMMDGSPDYDKPMSLEDAKRDVDNIKRDMRSNDEEIPEDLTAETYQEIWNSLLK